MFGRIARRVRLPGVLLISDDYDDRVPISFNKAGSAAAAA